MTLYDDGDPDGNIRGELNEQRVLDVLEWYPPSWVQSARRATPDENAMGIDLVVVTDVGHLLLQVKSSKVGAERWRRERIASQRRLDIAVVIVSRGLSDDSLRGRISGVLARVRAERLRTTEAKT